MKIIKSKNAVSDVIGTFLLLAIAIALFSIVNIVVFAYPFSPPTPSVNMIGSIEDEFIKIKHNYGDPLDLETKIILRIGTNSSEFTAKNDISLDSSGDGYWSIGETFKINHTKLSDPIAGKYVGVTVVDIETSSVIMMADLQKGTT